MEEVRKQEGKGKRSLVKCQVCGEIFDATLDNCPVCGVGREFYVPYEEEEISFQNNTDDVIVILGNGAAGISAAQAIRERDRTCSIYVISEEAVYSYNRPMLTKSLSTLSNAEEIAIHNKAWYKEKDIINLLNTKVTAIDTEDKLIKLSDGTDLTYDKCIYALGAECFIPPFSGSDKQGVIAIRSFADVEKIRAMMPSVKNTVVIGGGVLGLEAAWEMSKSSKVAVLEVADKLMVRQLDDAAGQLMGEIIEGLGIEFRINAKIIEITGEDKVTGVKLENGESFPADLVIISCGIRANTAIAKDAGIHIDRAIVVNERMETSIKDVYACGDCAQFQGINYAIWPQALEMGKIAGANAAGENMTYETVPAVLTFEGMNTALFSAGDNGKNSERSYKTIENGDSVKKSYEKYYFYQDRLVGVILIGDTSNMIALTEDLQQGQSYEIVERKYKKSI
ncbi:MAG: fold metallo-hydrolase [Herbinix sp.]|jgi:NAD(P)H-nitrite reductase large subunit|nr:fold metallo-hydrolase [Herbinix sp.]